MTTTVYTATDPDADRQAKTTNAGFAEAYSRDGWIVTARTGEFDRPLVFGEEEA